MNEAADFVVRNHGAWGPAYAAPKPQLQFICGSSLAGSAPPNRLWHVDGLIPGRTVSILSGDGGVGKTLLALQLAIATATGTSWIGHAPARGPVVFISAEDDHDELHRRLYDVAAGQGLRVEDLGDLHLLSLSGKDAVLAYPQPGSDAVEASPLFKAIEDAITKICPALVVLDPLADMFAGNEIVRVQARQFIGLLRGLALRSGAAVLLLSHPSQSGINSGSGASGSTAWNNSVRSRLYFDWPKKEDDAVRDPEARVLSLMKANYGPLNVSISLRWSNGVFALQEGTRSTYAPSQEEIDRRFLDLLSKFEREGRSVTSSKCSTHAPSQFAKHPAGKGISKPQFEAAMNRLFDVSAIRLHSEGPQSRRRSRIVRVKAE
jgi:RecA-family ATPase